MDKTKLLVGIFIALSLIGGTYYIANEDQANLYQCDEIVGLCFKLSKVNDAGISTRCYYNESAPTRYKNCKTGWIKSELVNITGKEVIIPDREVYKIDTDWTNRQDAEDYIVQLKSEITYTYHITTISQVPFSDSITVEFLGNIMRGEDRLARIGGVLSFKESVNKEEIELRVSKEAERRFNEWKPQIIISRGDKIV